MTTLLNILGGILKEALSLKGCMCLAKGESIWTKFHQLRCTSIESMLRLYSVYYTCLLVPLKTRFMTMQGSGLEL